MQRPIRLPHFAVLLAMCAVLSHGTMTFAQLSGPGAPGNPTGPSLSPGGSSSSNLCPMVLIARIDGSFCLFQTMECGGKLSTMFASCSTPLSVCTSTGCGSPLYSNGGTPLQINATVTADLNEKPSLYSNRTGMAAMKISELAAQSPSGWGQNGFQISFVKFVRVDGGSNGTSEYYALFRGVRPEDAIYKEQKVYFANRVQLTQTATVDAADASINLKPNVNGDIREIAIQESITDGGMEIPVWFHAFGAERR
ncbi:MAG: hypothetical protein KDA96_11145 [Planctomycetaceae bacterium]|nr:hypothetical protein [Planctomycetaceae bacterium]